MEIGRDVFIVVIIDKAVAKRREKGGDHQRKEASANEHPLRAITEIEQPLPDRRGGLNRGGGLILGREPCVRLTVSSALVTSHLLPAQRTGPRRGKKQI